jgi:hypothetical protein
VTSALGWVAGFVFAVALIIPGLLATFVLLFRNFLWREIIERLASVFPGWAFWWGLFVAVFIKFCLPYKIGEILFGYPVVAKTRSYIWLITYSLLGGLVFMGFVFWQATLNNAETFNWTIWIGPPLYVAWATPNTVFWKRLSEQEAVREAPPRWVGNSEFTVRYRLWRGFMTPALAIGRDLFDWDWKKRFRANVPFGDARAATSEELKKAGL